MKGKGSHNTALRISLFSLILMLCAVLPVVSGKVYPYLVYLPQGYDQTTERYPVIIYLHGSSQRGNDLNRLKSYGMPKYLESGGKLNSIVIAPQCPPGILWDTEEWFLTTFNQLKEKYRIDLERVYLTGVSMGGGGTFEIAKKHPGLFAALVPLCAWQSSTTDLCKLSKLPIWTLHGENDTTVPISETEAKVTVLKKCKANIRYNRLSEEGHSIHWIYENPERYDIYSWMFKHKRNSSQR